MNSSKQGSNDNFDESKSPSSLFDAQFSHISKRMRASVNIEDSDNSSNSNSEVEDDVFNFSDDGKA